MSKQYPAGNARALTFIHAPGVGGLAVMDGGPKGFGVLYRQMSGIIHRPLKTLRIDALKVVASVTAQAGHSRLRRYTQILNSATC